MSCDYSPANSNANIVYKRTTSVLARHVHVQTSTHTPSKDINMDLSTNLQLLNLPDDNLVQISRSVPIDENIFEFLAKFNKTNKRLHTLLK